MIGGKARYLLMICYNNSAIHWLSDFGKVDQSGEGLLLIISNNSLLKFGLISSVGSIFYFGSISSTLNY